MSQLPLNLSRLDATVRLLLVPLWLVTDGWLIHNLSPSWAPTLILHGMVLTAYLLLTGALRIDPLYLAYDHTSLRGDRGRRVAMQRARHRPQG